jgi:hypothetical protein
VSIIVRPTPEVVTHKQAVPFKVFIPRDLLGNLEAASAGYQALSSVENIVAADPFVAAGVSSVFPGIIYVDELLSYEEALAAVAASLSPAVSDWPEDYEDAWIELWMPEAYEPAAEALAIDDLTQG